MSSQPSTSAEAAVHPRIGILVVAYNASATVAKTLGRLPDSFVETLDHILVCDDASNDDTYEVAVDFRSRTQWPLTVVRHETNLGYGGNQKAGYRWAIEHGLDIVVLLHGDGQYAPEVIEDIVAPLVSGDADASFGSRMMEPRQALKGGMPLYKYVGNKILTQFQNQLTGLELSEWHSGYRAYRVDALAELPLDTYSDGFDFDTEIILGLASAKKRIAECPIPTYYGDEICYVDGVKYAKDVTTDVVRHWAHQRGFGGGVTEAEPDHYALKTVHGSHGVLLNWLDAKPRGRVLDAGCFDGRFAAHVVAMGHHVVGIDKTKHDGLAGRVHEFLEADLNQPLPSSVPRDFDYVVAGDILEHVLEPHELLTDLRDHMTEDGEILVSVPNFNHWYPRGRITLGRFDYDQRGPLDRGHVRFFTRKSVERMFDACGMRIIDRAAVGTPFHALGASHERAAATATSVDHNMMRLWPQLFTYQWLYRLERA
ncbi:hypothetical protein GCM10009795_015190 [Nocardioides hankookensis]|uniref:Glycosyltransferase n=1 Tax=Nocardioides hankookensis TaxID=443157 RepID=A0ABW1LIK0_9ACTN